MLLPFERFIRGEQSKPLPVPYTKPVHKQLISNITPPTKAKGEGPLNVSPKTEPQNTKPVIKHTDEKAAKVGLIILRIYMHYIVDVLGSCKSRDNSKIRFFKPSELCG